MSNATTLATSSSTSSPEGNVVIEALVLCVIIFVSVLGNLSLWIVILRSKALRTVTNMFILGLSAADLFVATVNMPVTVYVIIKGYWNLSESACVITGFTNMLTLVTSVLSLCNISINRYIMVVRPGKFREIYTKRKAIAMITGVFLLATLLSALPLFGWAEYKFIPTHSFCFADWANHMSYAFFMIGCCFCCPCGVMTVCNIFIFRAVRKSRQKVKISIRPASELDKSRHSANNSEISNIQDISAQEVNCSSTDEDNNLQTEGGLDKININGSPYGVHKPSHIDLEDDYNDAENEITDKYQIRESHSPVLQVKAIKNDTVLSEKNGSKSTNRTLNRSSDNANDFVAVETTGASELSKSFEEEYLSSTSSNETTSLRSYNKAFERTDRTRGRPVIRNERQLFLTIPKKTNYLRDQKNVQLRERTISNSSIHSTDSDASMKSNPIEITFKENSDLSLTENNNTVTENDKAESHTPISKHNNSNNYIIETEPKPSILTYQNGDANTCRKNGTHRTVSINDQRKTSVDHTNDTSMKLENSRRSAFLSRKHSSPPPRRREEIVLARSLAVVVILFVLCWLPYCISMLLSIFYSGTVPRGFHMFTLIIGYANSGCNPIVYGAMNKRFAHGYKTLFCFWKDHRLSFNSSSM